MHSTISVHVTIFVEKLNAAPCIPIAKSNWLHLPNSNLIGSALFSRLKITALK